MYNMCIYKYLKLLIGRCKPSHLITVNAPELRFNAHMVFMCRVHER